MADKPPPKFVPDSPFGNLFGSFFGQKQVTLDDVIGAKPEQADGAEKPPVPKEEDRVWPAVPVQFQLPPAHLEETIKEVRFILQTLRTTLSPTPLPEDDLHLLSEFLLSLETRTDLTTHVLLNTDIDTQLLSVQRCKVFPDDSQFNFSARARALKDHITAFNRKTEAENTAGGPLPDTSLPPLKTAPEERTLKLTESQSQHAEEDYASYIQSKRHAYSYFIKHPPVPMAWSPKTGDAWKNTDRHLVESGNLYFSDQWKPMYMSFAMQRMDVPFSWVNPEEGEVSKEVKDERMKASMKITDRSLDMRKEREAYMNKMKKT